MCKKVVSLILLLCMILVLLPVGSLAAEQTVTVTFSMLGDSIHGEDTRHTLVDGNLEIWIPAQEYTLPADAVILDVLQIAAEENGVTFVNEGNFISSITKDGVTLEAFTNGPLSGWMYTLNGEYPAYGVAEQGLRNGDAVIFHYTDDYNREYAAENTPPEPNPTEPPATEPPATQPPATEPSGPDRNQVYEETAAWIQSQKLTAGSEWFVLGLGRAGNTVPDSYYRDILAYVQNNADENGRLHRTKATENARIILALAAIGVDATDVGGIDLIAGISSLDFVKKQGINGVIWTLIALDSGNYAASGDVTRDGLIHILLDAECSGGGWATSGGYADPDMTGMALQALAPYCDTDPDVKAAADRAVGELSKMQKADGGFATVGLATSESAAQVIVALTALEIDPHTDARFIKDGKSAVDALLSYYVEGGGFRHVQDGDRDSIATEQGYYALVAYARFLEGKNRLYDMTDVLDKGGDGNAPAQPMPTEPAETAPPATEPAPVVDSKDSFPWWIVVVVGAACVVVVVILRRKK